MGKTIYCKTVAKGIQAFYIIVGSKTYFLFNQKYYAGVRNYFAQGRRIDDLSSACKDRNAAVRRTANKLPSYLRYIEKEYDIVIYDKRVKQNLKTYKSKNAAKMRHNNEIINDYYNDFIA